VKRATAPVVAALIALLVWIVPGAAAAPAGDVRLAKGAGSEMDHWMIGAGPARRAWFRRNYERMKGYAPWFNPRLSWYPDAWAYQDLYAVYTDEREDGSHLPYVLRDGAGRRLFIPWGCDGSGCPQYAADPGNPAFRRAWIAEAARKLRAGYRGLYVDDASLAMFVGDSGGDLEAPIDPRTGGPMRKEDWRRYVTEFLEEIRRAFPKVEIVHNANWWVAPLSDPLHRRQVKAADWLVIEHAFTEGGLTGGDGPLSFRAYFRHMDALHEMGRHIVLDSDGSTAPRRELLLAGYLIANDGGDLLSSWERTEPDDLWKGFRLKLGRARGDRYRWRGVWRRDFAGGTALVSDPGTSPRELPIRGRRISGERVRSVTLGDREGAVVLRGR
jgi:Hypothetical glycosyl hydrolase family 15